MGFNNCIDADGTHGFKAEAGRYHLYISWACPFAHRSVIARKLKGLEDVISMSTVDPVKYEKGWEFTENKDPCNHCNYLSELYKMSDPNYDGRYSVPVLWDKQKKTIVNTESAEIVRMFNSQFNAFCKTKEQAELNLYPDDLKEKIDGINEWVAPLINGCVYRVGFATTQEAYDNALKKLFEGLDKAESILERSRYLTGNQLTEADVRLFASLVRFDKVYHYLFKCNKKRILDYPNLWGFTRDLYQHQGIGIDTVKMDYIQISYMRGMLHINPNGIVSPGPDIDFMSAHGRDKLFQ
eukprot:gene323-954_t